MNFGSLLSHISSVHIKFPTLYFWCYYKQSQSISLKQGIISAKVIPEGLATG